jgi:signal peptidase I
VTADDPLSGRQPTATTSPSAVADAPPFQAPSAPTAPAAATKNGSRRKRHTSSLRNLIEWVVIIGAALLVALVIKQFLVQAFYIPSESMENTLKVGDRVLVNKLSYHMHDVHRGDIVVFKRPPAEAGEPAIKDLIKRVIAGPGDTIEGRDGVVYVNGQALNETYLPSDSCPGQACTTNLPKQVVPADHYFVMGDNRTNSKDSRVFGPISRSLIVGRAFVRVYPLSKIGFL